MTDRSDTTASPLTAGGWFGLLPPATAAIAWGARAITTGHRLDLVWDRKQCRPGPHGGTLPPFHEEFHATTYRLVADLGKRLADSDPDLDGRSDAVTEMTEGRIKLKASPNSSFGYLYIVGWIDRDDLTAEELVLLERAPDDDNAVA